MTTWRCVKQCGACCHLDPAERPNLDEYLSPDELEQYLNMVGQNGWCINFDPITRTCKIYAERPRFCRVTSEVFHNLFGIEPEELNDFAIACCQQQISAVYGEHSREKIHFNRFIEGNVGTI